MVWTKAVSNLKRGQGSSLNFVVGDYGFGKTVSLYSIVEQYAKDNSVHGIYIKLLREDLTSKFGVDIIQRIFYNVKKDRISTSKAKKALSQLGAPQTPQRNIIMKWIEGDELANSYLTGRDQLKSADLAKLGVRQNIKSTDVAKEYFILLLLVLKESGISVLLLCIDEVEYLFSQMRGAKLANVINTLRDLYDLPTSQEVKGIQIEISNLGFFFGISQSGWNNLNNLVKRERSQGGPIQPLLSRKNTIIELAPLNLSETEELIEKRLRWNRLANRMEGEPLIPYTKDYVKYVYQLTLGNPREIIERCDYTLQDGIEKKAAKLTRVFAKTVFEERGLLSEPKA